jgi:adenylosuccinate synthase
MKTSIVLGLQYGDEGKGLTTSFLSKKNDLVVRFNGGHQAGHTVVKDGYRHVFSNFGSGTLNGAHTYWSQYCTFYPKSFYNERQALSKDGFDVVHYIHPMAMITTPFDIGFNRATESSNRHGSVGVGFGATIARNETQFKLYAIDLTCRPLLIHKLRQIAGYYKIGDPGKEISTFIEYVDKISLNICTLDKIKHDYSHIVFEGAQGIMLDMDFGYFPNVTRSHTTSKNAMQIIQDCNLPTPNVYYAMRSYLTRHGNGFMPNESDGLSFEDKTNVSHAYQGEFRQGYHSMEQLRYALNCDATYSGYDFDNKNLVISCLDQTNNVIFAEFSKLEIGEFLTAIGHEFANVFINHSPEGKLAQFKAPTLQY